MAEVIAPVLLDRCIYFTYPEIRYIWKFKKNIHSLSSSMSSLERKREANNLMIIAANNNGEGIRPDVEEWMEKVEVMKKEVDGILQGTTNAQLGCFLYCKFPNLKVRYSLSKKAATKMIEIADLQGKGEFSRVGYPAPIGQMTFTSPREVSGFDSRLHVEKRVIKALLDDEIHVIAVCGMGGVGKTTMVKKIADEIIKKNHFDEVALAAVSQNYDPINVQQQLAENLGLKFEETTLHARAARLHLRLMDQGKRIVIIIDDLWEEIALRAIGIPVEDERKGLKVLITSRLRGECGKMEVNEIIEVGVLTNKEAWGLFKKHANIRDVESDFLENYPRKVADKCQGLPLAIEIIGKTLKDNKNLSEWRDALRELQTTSEDSLYDKMYSSIAWSVNYLKSQGRSLLLLCSLFPEDCEIYVEDLVRYVKGLKLFDNIDKMSETRDRVKKMCNELKDCYLLIACGKNRVKLHDVVRETCLRIASKGENVYMVSHSGQTEWPDNKEKNRSYTAISLAVNALNRLPSLLTCSSLQLLRLSLNRNKNSMNIIPLTSFLRAMEKLKVLNINDSEIELPPQSLQTSVSLRTLNLHNCRLIGDLSPLLSSLETIEVLSFYRSLYDGEFPKVISELNNLKSLDLRFVYGPRESFPAGILIHLKKLEELYLGEATLGDEVIRELGSLSNLNTFEIGEAYSVQLAVLVDNLNVDRLLRFSIGSNNLPGSKYQFSRRIILHDINIDMLLNPKMKFLLSKVDEDLTLERVTGYIDEDLWIGIVFSGLKNLRINNCEMKYICNSTDSHTRTGFFDDLEKLEIGGAKQLEELCHGDIPHESFSRLKSVYMWEVPLLSCLWGPIKPPCLGSLTILKIQGSKAIRSLLLGSSVKCFARLRVIEIEECPKLESLVSCDAQSEEDPVENNAQFPELEEVYLRNVDSFKTFFSEPAPKVLVCRTSSNIPVFRKLSYLEIINSDHLNVVTVTRNVQNISSLMIRGCPVEVCFDFEGWFKEIASGEVAERVFHNLDSLNLGELPNLRSLWRNLPEGISAFPNLTTLTISDCGSLKHLVTPSMAKMLLRLKTLDISRCAELKAIVGSKVMGPLEDFSASDCLILPEGTVAFPKKLALTISDCESLKHLLTASMAKMLDSLKRLEIRGCEKLDAVVGSEDMGPLEETSISEKVSLCKVEMIFDQLEHLTLLDLPQLRYFGRMIPEGTTAFHKLLTLEIKKCRRLTYLFTPPMVKMFANLRELIIGYCDQIESIIGSEEFDEAATNEEEGSVAFPRLLTLKIKKCRGLKYLLTPPTVKMFPSLKKLKIGYCYQMESIIGSEEVDNAATNEAGHGKEEIVLPQLCYLQLTDLPELRMVSSHSVDLVLRSLNALVIKECPMINRFCAGSLIAPELQIRFIKLRNISHHGRQFDTFDLDFETTRKLFKDCESGKSSMNRALEEMCQERKNE